MAKCVRVLFMISCMVVGVWLLLYVVSQSQAKHVSYDKVFHVPYSAVLFSDQGLLLNARIAQDEQWRFPTQTHVPSKFARALITFEDKRFWQHRGIDLLAIFRALYSNIIRGERVSGASTLTMQVVRLSYNHPQRTYWQKLKEVFAALVLEHALDKSQILALYAAHAPFGGNIVGLEAASWRYFGRNSRSLSWGESALLAVLPNNPAMIRPGFNQHRLLAKRQRLLNTLYQIGEIDRLELDLALQEPVPQGLKAWPRQAPHLLDALAYQADKQAMNAQQHIFHSTLSKHWQKYAAEQLKSYQGQLSTQGIHNSAALIIDNRELSVKAYIANSAYELQGEQGYAIDLVHRPRSSGSLFKPFLYAAMLESSDLIPGLLVPDVPHSYGGYNPENFDREYRGAVRVEAALAQSLNVPAVHLLQQFGVGRFQHYLQQRGLDNLHRRPDEYGLSLIIGGAETTLWEMAQAYALLAASLHCEQEDLVICSQSDNEDENSGVMALKLLQASSQYLSAETSLDAIDPAAAWLTLQALLQVQRPGAERFWRTFISSRSVAWKTGTSYGHRDAWAVGVTPNYTVAVWVGNASGQGVAGLTGASAAAPLLFDLMNGLPHSSWFSEPSKALKTVSVCEDNGYLASPYCKSVQTLIPQGNRFNLQTPHHQRIHVDKQGWRVHSGCESVFTMRAENRFILPTKWQYYYQDQVRVYRPLPEWRADCEPSLTEQSRMTFLYPLYGSQVYVPIDIDAKKSRFVARLVHQQEARRVYWYLDQHYIGETRDFHELALDASQGEHTLYVVDDEGQSMQTRFYVLSEMVY